MEIMEIILMLMVLVPVVLLPNIIQSMIIGLIVLQLKQMGMEIILLGEKDIIRLRLETMLVDLSLLEEVKHNLIQMLILLVHIQEDIMDQLLELI